MSFLVIIIKTQTHVHVMHLNSVKPVLSSHSKIDKTKVLKTYGSLMKVKSIRRDVMQSSYTSVVQLV